MFCFSWTLFKQEFFSLCMIVTLLGAYIFHVDFMTLTLGHRYVRNNNCKLCFFLRFLDSCLDSCLP